MNVPARQEGISYKSVPMASHGGGGMLMPQTFGEVVAFSEIMARSQHAIPKHLRDVPGACLAVAMQAMRWSMDPFAVASKSYNVKDIIAYEAQLIAAVVHTRAPLKTRPDYAYTGEGQDRRCTVSALFEDGVTRSYESPRVGDITTKNSPLWKADTDQQLGYYSIRAFARRYCPEVILGVYTPEEAETFRGPDNARDVTPRPSLSERLSNSTASTAAAGEGFSQSHVISEIGGDPQSPPAKGDASHSETQQDPPSESSVASESISSEAAMAQAEVPAPELAPPSLGAGTLNSESSVSQADDGGGDGSLGNETRPSPSLPEGWTVLYAAALRKAQKPISLPKYATAFWESRGGWTAHQDGPNGATAVAIYDAFAENFGDKEQIDAILREIV